MIRFAGRIEPAEAPLPAMQFRWDPETEILAGRLEGARGTGGYTGTIELEDPRGPILALDVKDGTLTSFEVVVWPEVEVVEGLTPPGDAAPARLVVPPRPSQPGIALTEVEQTIGGRRTLDEAVFHLTVGPRRPVKGHRLADHLVMELDGDEQPAGFWLSGVPPFPRSETVR